MLRRYWRLGFAFVGFLAFLALLGGGYYLNDAYKQRNAEHDYQPASQARLPVRVQDETQPEPYQPDCNNPQSREDADLCAQWAAVEQVTESNRLSSRSLQLSIGALFFTIIGTGLLVWTLTETRDTSRRQLRAYFGTSGAVIFGIGTARPRVGFEVQNFGQTPAYNVHVHSVVDCVVDKAAELTYDDTKDLGITDPGHKQTITRIPGADWWAEHINRIQKADAFLVIAARIEYDDVFGHPRFREFRYYLEPLYFRIGDVDLSFLDGSTGN